MEKYYKGNIGRINDKTIDFQIIEWWAKDEIEDEGNDENSDNSDNDIDKTKYNIYCFGKTSDGTSVTCKIINFYPFYFVKIPKSSKGNVSTFVDFLKGRLYKYQNCIKEDLCKFIYKKDLYGFRNDTEYKFIKLVFKNMYTK